MKKYAVAVLASILWTAPVIAPLMAEPAIVENTHEEFVDDEGITNPEELTLRHFVKFHDFKKDDPMHCMLGYFATKKGWHEGAAKIFKECSDGGNEASMIWMAQLYSNGLGVPKDLRKAADLEKQAAQRGYSIGQYNYGLSLLRGHGAEYDLDSAKMWLGKAAEQGDASAHTLIRSGYNVDVAIPDADEKKDLW